MTGATGCRSPLLRHRRLAAEAGSFLAIGLFSMAVYSSTVTGLVELTGAHPLAGTAAGFLTGTAVSYVGNTLLSFREQLAISTMVRFTIATLAGFGLNLGIMQAALMAGLPYWAGILAVMATVPAFNFLIHKFWTYRSPGLKTR